jgi:hypothetical protein
MGFASEWLEYGTLFPVLINEAPAPDTGMILVVPSFDEPAITRLLDSLALCKLPGCPAEVIIIINAPVTASAESLENNIQSVNEIEVWKLKNPDSFFRLFPVNLGQPSIKGWGVGLARKAGMDEAARRFNHINKPDGLIVNLDADCRVQDNYFITLENELLNSKNRKGCSIYFEHPVSGTEFPEEVYNSAYQYELHLRYYFQALLYTGFPNVFHTVGSSIAVKCLTYIKAGGMNRRQAGEDFYFVQKLLPAGGYFNLNLTTVYPSPRVSGRVPFGTGAAVGKMVTKHEKQYQTYNPLAFKDLCTFFKMSDSLFYCNTDNCPDLFNDLPESLKRFLKRQEWDTKISEIKGNTSGLESFRKRFFEWFNMFRIVKYLNFSHLLFFEKIPVLNAAEELLNYKKSDPAVAKAIGYLFYYRNMERQS